MFTLTLAYLIAPSYTCLAILTYPHPRPQPCGRSGGAAAAAAATAAAAAAAGGRQSHRAGWLEQNLDVLAVSDAFGRFRAILTFWSIFSRFGMFFDVFRRF